MRKFVPLIPVLVLLILIINRKPTQRHVQLPLINVPHKVVRPVIEQLNKSNAAVTSVYCDDIDVSISGSFFKLKATIAQEKGRKFRMITSSFLGKESDIGSNDQMFWFWSKRMAPSALYYADYKDMAKTRLKTPFHPVWMMEALGLNKIEIDDSTQFSQRGGLYYVVTPTVTAVGRPVTRMAVIDMKRCCVVEQHVFEHGACVSSVQIVEQEQRGDVWVPKKLIIVWHSENVTMTWTLRQVQINTKLATDYWTMPNIKPSIDMTLD